MILILKNADVAEPSETTNVRKSDCVHSDFTSRTAIATHIIRKSEFFHDYFQSHRANVLHVYRTNEARIFS